MSVTFREEKSRLQIILEADNRIEISLAGEILYRAYQPLSPMEVINLIRAKYPMLGLQGARALWLDREELNIKYD